MTSQVFNTADELKRLISEDCITLNALQTITGIPRDALESFLLATPSGDPGLSTTPVALSSDESARLSALVAQLSEGLQIDDDVRVRAIVETLTAQCHLTIQNIAQLTRIGVGDLEAFLLSPAAVPPERKYELAVRASYLLTSVANATRR